MVPEVNYRIPRRESSFDPFHTVDKEKRPRIIGLTPASGPTRLINMLSYGSEPGWDYFYYLTTADRVEASRSPVVLHCLANAYSTTAENLIKSEFLLFRILELVE
jgi:hypothetical protein